METGAVKLLDAALYRRGVLVTALARWLSFGLAFLCFAFVWNLPETRPRPAAAVLVGYLAIQLAASLPRRGYPSRRWVKALLDATDSLAVGLGAAFSGGLRSPIWLLLYPHAVAVSVRRGLLYAMAFSALDAAIVVLLAWGSDQPLGALHALAILFCGFMGGTTSSYLHAVQNRLSRVNEELGTANRQLSQTLGAQIAAQRQQELALARYQASEERYRRLLERIQDGVLIIQEGRAVYANQAFASMVGETPEALRGRDFLELAPPDDRDELARRYRTWEEKGTEAGSLECRLRRHDGSALLASVRAGSVEFEGRRSVIATVRDISRERAMERDLKAHAGRLAAVNELANAVDLNLTVEDILRVVAEGATRLLSFEELTIALVEEAGQAVDLLLPVEGGLRHERLPVRRDELAWAFGGGFGWCRVAGSSAPTHAERLLGREVASLATVPLVFKGRVIGSLNLGRREPVPFSSLELAALEPLARHVASALENARLLEAVRRRSEELESLLEVGRSITERLDLRDVLPLVTRSVNRVMDTRHCLLLLRSGDRLTVAAQEGIEPEGVEIFKDLLVGESLSGRVVSEGRPIACEEMGADPRLKFAEIVRRYGYRSFLGVPLRRGSEILGTLEVVTKEPRLFSPEEQDVMAAFAAQAAVAIDNARLLDEAHVRLSEAEEARRRLEDLHRLRQQYLRNVSHEFRTPLTVIKGYAEFLKESPPGTTSLSEVLGIVVESSDRLIDMVDTLIDVSRLEQEEAEKLLHVQSLDLAEVAGGSVESFRGPAARKGIALELDFPGMALRLQGDANLLHQVVRKLVDNALKYSPNGGRVVVRGREDGEELSLEVADQGIGIPPEHVPRIFEKFYTVDGSLTRRVGGTGVGLYLVREIVRLHQGTVSVESLPGQGSVFSVRLPRQLRGTWRQPALA